MSNGKRSKFDDSQLLGQYTDRLIPKGSHIHKVELFFHKFNSLLVGLKFFDKKGEEILSCGDYDFIDKELGEVDYRIAEREFILEDNERLIGIKSNKGDSREAKHYSV